MFIVKHVVPLIILSLLVGVMIARVDFSSFTVSSAPGMRQQSPAKSEEGGEAWSVDAFVADMIKREGTVDVETSAGNDVAAQRSWVADRAKTGPTGNPYLSSILEEARDLAVAVTALPTVKERLVMNNSTLPAAKVVTVVEGESLIDIAVRVYGDRRAYLRIFDANRDVISNPDQIYVGQRLRIPD